MNRARFESDRAPAWAELDELLARAHGRPERLGADGIRRLGALYRGVAADLAEARRRFGDDPLVARLEALVTRARPVVYSAPSRRGSLRDFMATGYWRLVAERPLLLALATLGLFGPGLLALVWALGDPGAAAGLVPQEFRGAGEGGGVVLEDGGEQAEFASVIFTNNIRVAFLAFAGGVLAGVGTLLVLTYNGVLLGAIFGLGIGAGNGYLLTVLVAPHGFLELSIIVVAGAAGLRMGWALVEPGTRTRAAALAAEARCAVQIVLGTMPWFVLAGLVEGFVTPRRLSAAAAVGLGAALAALYWALVAWRGWHCGADRGRSPSRYSRALRFAPR